MEWYLERNVNESRDFFLMGKTVLPCLLIELSDVEEEKLVI